MGVHGLWRLLDAFGQVTRPEDWAGRRVAIDASIWIAQFRAKAELGDDLERRVLEGFFLRILKLLFYGIDAVFVFDGPSSGLKTTEKRRRVARRDAAAQAFLRRRAQQIVTAQVAAGVLQLQALPSTQPVAVLGADDDDAVVTSAYSAAAEEQQQQQQEGGASSVQRGKRTRDSDKDTVAKDDDDAVVVAEHSRKCRRHKQRRTQQQQQQLQQDEEQQQPTRLHRRRRRRVLAPDAVSARTTAAFLDQAKEYQHVKDVSEQCVRHNVLRHSSTSLFMGPRNVLDGTSANGDTHSRADDTATATTTTAAATSVQSRQHTRARGDAAAQTTCVVDVDDDSDDSDEDVTVVPSTRTPPRRATQGALVSAHDMYALHTQTAATATTAAKDDTSMTTAAQETHNNVERSDARAAGDVASASSSSSSSLSWEDVADVASDARQRASGEHDDQDDDTSSNNDDGDEHAVPKRDINSSNDTDSGSDKSSRSDDEGDDEHMTTATSESSSGSDGAHTDEDEEDMASTQDDEDAWSPNSQLTRRLRDAQMQRTHATAAAVNDDNASATAAAAAATVLAASQDEFTPVAEYAPPPRHGSDRVTAAAAPAVEDVTTASSPPPPPPAAVVRAFASDVLHRRDTAVRNDNGTQQQQQQHHYSHNSTTATRALPPELADVVQLLEYCGMAYVVSPAEADAQCAFLGRARLVDAVFSEDSDVVVHGAPVVLRGFFAGERHVVEYRQAELRACGLDKAVLVALALLLGCDYTEGVPGIGLVGAVDAIAAGWCVDGSEAARGTARIATATTATQGGGDDDGDATRVCEVLTRWRRLLHASPHSWREADETVSVLQYALFDRHRVAWASVRVDADFPARHVAEAFYAPAVDGDTTPFAPAQPQWEALRQFAGRRGLLAAAWTMQRFELARRACEKRAAAAAAASLSQQQQQQQRKLTEFGMRTAVRERWACKKLSPQYAKALEHLRAVRTTTHA